jgi:hypothetical protein
MQDQEQSGHAPAEAGSAPENEPRLIFPKHSVVGVIDTAEQVSQALDALRAAGFDESSVHVISGDHAIELIDQSGSGHGLRGRLTRMTQAMFGMEMEHTERHVAEVEAGHFLVLVPSHDGETATRISDVLAAQGGHFINYYTNWTAQTLLH